MAAGAGAGTLAGTMYSPGGKTWSMDASERTAVVRRLVEKVRPLADYAGDQGVTLALEPLNRFETSFMNTAEQVMEVVVRDASPALGALLDTFHMNIEEHDPAAAKVVQWRGGTVTKWGLPGGPLWARVGLKMARRDGGSKRLWIVERTAAGGWKTACPAATGKGVPSSTICSPCPARM